MNEEKRAEARCVSRQALAELAMAMLVLPRIQRNTSVYAGFAGQFSYVKHLHNMVK